MNAWFQNLFVLVCALSIAACSGSSSESNSAPSPNPGNPGGNLPPVHMGGDPRLPDLSRAMPIQLVDNVTYQGLAELTFPSNMQFPVVGDALVQLTLPNDRSSTPSSLFRFGYEDALGFFGGDVPSFPGASFRTTSSLDIIYSDSLDSFRVLAAMTTADQIFGRIYYRRRQAGETQCQQVQVTYCPPGMTCTPPDTTTPCRQYMELNNSQVKDLGAFSGAYSRFLQ